MPLSNPSYVFGEDIEPSRIVKMGAADHTVVKATTADRGVGITHNGTREAPIPGVTPLNGKSGESGWVHGPGAVCEVLAGAAITKGQTLGPTTADLSAEGYTASEAGVAIPVTGTAAVIALALADCPKGQMCSVQVEHFNLPGT